mmetsp:Transcript_49172/g.77742  ORF Transcript_49172/g.77742 Transcript_49172/m.77742 type:complete len:146 (-) Transcript_49172:69-506(-)|eukprot:CAMPEP_0169143454 /NCGR_PEP_ID=MMETSP1015-20121227/45605_1 /TAXON_ID=342587 /ORGANISM="Karlodinium micrum, Strain CCMP2283" /LENGTH=145 /DNA_ID=CAMNT_0009210415 /DNA_START=59 /DNA_END=496 /DNA_ORIENTATION=+
MPACDFHGSYHYPNSDLFAGVLNVRGKPNGKGVLYHFESGECTVGTFDSDLKMKGDGVRFSKMRDFAVKLSDGSEGGELSLEAAQKLVGLAQVPIARSKDSIPAAMGASATRKKQVGAWYNYRSLAQLPSNESAYASNAYPPVWA